MAKAFAPAKINLTLHVTGQTAEGYHLLDSLVVFADVGDWVEAAPGDLSLTVTGPQAEGVPDDASNLVWKAARWLKTPAQLTLEKHLPSASGIGGGSSDAAATIRALCDLTVQDLPDPARSAALGADVPVCLVARPRRMTGIGDRLQELPDLPPLHVVLANPGVAVSTSAVFNALKSKTNRPMPETLPDWPDTPSFARWLGQQRNDLELPARSLAPAIGVTLMRLAQTGGALLTRMSGSGATCFALFETRPEADAAAETLRAVHPDWWITAASGFA